MATILAVHKNVEQTMEAVNNIGYMGSQIDEVKHEQHIKAYKNLENDNNWKGYYYSIAILGAALKTIASAAGSPEVGEVFGASSYGSQIGASWQDGYIARDNGDIDRNRNVLSDVSSRKRQLHEVLDQVTKQGDRIMDTLAKNSHSAPVA